MSTTLTASEQLVSTSATARTPEPTVRTGAKAVLSTPGFLALLTASILARLPLAMRGISLLVYTQRMTGSFAVAGVVSASYALGSGASGPFLGRLVDRYGQTIVLLTTAVASSILLAAIALAPSSIPHIALIALAVGVGLATPPLNGSVRALLPRVIRQPETLRSAYAMESTALELTFILGPPFALGLAALWSTRAALVTAGAVLLVATASFAAQPASRRWVASPRSEGRHQGALRSAGMRTLIVALFAVGVLFGATQVGVTAVATKLGSQDVAGLLLGLWGVGSLIGGIAATRFDSAARGVRGLVLILAGLALGHAALGIATHSLLAIGGVIVIAGFFISPAYATIYAMVDHVAAADSMTAAFSWLSSAIVLGDAAGSAAGGSLIQGVGVAAPFVLAGVAGILAMAVTAMRARTLAE